MSTSVEQHAVPMRDGVSLAADVYRTLGRRLPTILLRTPYDRRDLRDRLIELDPLRAARAGFAVAIQDLRGRHGSHGAFEALAPDVEDGADTVAWIRAQEWSDGRVVMVGASYGGCVQFQAARARPEGLLALAPTVSGSVVSIWHPGGALRLSAIGDWFAKLVEEALAGPLDGYDAAAHAELDALRDAPPLDRLHAFLDPRTAAWRVGAPLRHWLTLPLSDRYWTETTAVPAAPLPALHTTGSADLCLAAATDAYAAWSARGEAAAPQLLTLGPWTHDLRPMPCPPLGLTPPRTPDLLVAHERQLAFLASVLAGTPGDGLAPVRSFVLGRNRWHEDVRWPPPDARPFELALAPDGDDDGALVREPRGERALHRWRHDPRDPVPACGGAHAVWDTLGPLDQAEVESRDDVLTFTSACFDGEMEIAGSPLARLLVGSSATATDVVAKLTVVLPDGRSLALSDGNWSGRLADLPAADGDGSLRRCELALAPLHVALAPGMRLRLQVASSRFPDLYPNPGTGEPLHEGLPARWLTAEQTLLSGPGSSTLELPVRGTAPREVAA